MDIKYICRLLKFNSKIFDLRRLNGPVSGEGHFRDGPSFKSFVFFETRTPCWHHIQEKLKMASSRFFLFTLTCPSRNLIEKQGFFCKQR